MLRVAGVGAGYFSRFHYDAWRRIPGASLVAVSDRDPARAATVGVAAYPAAEAMLAAVRPDLLDLIVPPVEQAALIRLAIGAGVPAIICQKPFGADLAEAEALTAEAEAAGTRLIVHENFRFQPWYRLIRAEIAAGHLGRVLNATFRLRPGDGQGPQAYLDRQPYFRAMPQFLIRETGVHFIDLVGFLFGPPTAVYAGTRW
jgi:predicted dehydrogenase